MEPSLISGRHYDYREQSHSDLCLAVFDGPPFPERFTVYKQSSFYLPFSTSTEGPPVRVVLRIIGESHAVSVEYPDHSFLEILACSHALEPPPANFWQMERLLTFTERRCDLRAGRYRNSFSCRPLNEVSATNWFYRVADYRSVIKYSFPSQDVRLSPYTLIGAFMTEASTLVFRSVHSYPNEEMMVLSESELNLNPEGCI